MNIIFGRNKPRLPKGMTFRLTQQGAEKAQNYSGDPKSRVLIALESEGSMTIDEIAHETGISKSNLERLVPQLMRGGYISSSTSLSSSEELD